MASLEAAGLRINDGSLLCIRDARYVRCRCEPFTATKVSEDGAKGGGTKRGIWKMPEGLCQGCVPYMLTFCYSTLHHVEPRTLRAWELSCRWHANGQSALCDVSAERAAWKMPESFPPISRLPLYIWQISLDMYERAHACGPPKLLALCQTDDRHFA